jgi:streptogrisin C
MSARSEKKTRLGVSAVALTVAIATCTAGLASAEDRRPVLSKEVAHAMKRDLKMNDAQLARYFNAERVAFANEALIARRLGASYAGSWLERGADGEFRFVAATTGSPRRAMPYGVELRHHRYSLLELDNAVEELNRIRAAMPKKANMDAIQSWGVDVQNNRVVVTYAPGQIPAAIDFVASSTVDASMFRFESSNGVRSIPLATAIAGNPYQNVISCSIGFTVRKLSVHNDYGFISAGHCGEAGTAAYINGQFVGNVQGSQFSSNGDMSFVDIQAGHNVANYVNKYDGTTQVVLGYSAVGVGTAVCHSGRVAGWRCGKILSKNNTVTYGGVSVTGLTKTSACGGQGDSGGPFLTASGWAQGITATGVLAPGQTNNCSDTNPVTHFQPIGPILSAYSLVLV